MANTRTAAKRARQAIRRQAQNQIVKSTTRTSLRNVVEAIKTKDVAKTKETYNQAVKALSRAASKGTIPKTRAARKISRLTRLAQKTVPAAFARS